MKEREKKPAHNTSPSKRGPSLKQWRVISKHVCEKGCGIKPCLTIFLLQNLQHGTDLGIEMWSWNARLTRDYVIKF